MPTTDHTPLHIIRHARPLIAPKTCYGRLDIPADSQHTQQSARQFVQHLHNNARHHMVQLLCSPLQRCQQLVQALIPLLEQAGFTVHNSTKADLAELDFGSWEGMLWDDTPKEEWQAWEADFAHYAIGGGESVAQLIMRVQRMYVHTMQHLAQHPHTHMVWVAHAGIMHALSWLQQQPSMTSTALPQQANQWAQTQACDFGQWRRIHLLENEPHP